MLYENEGVRKIIFLLRASFPVILSSSTCRLDMLKMTMGAKSNGIVEFIFRLSCPCSRLFKCERVRINNSTLASDSPWSHEWNLGYNANHLRCDVEPVERNREQQRHLTEGKHLAKEPQRCTHTHTRARVRPRAGAGPAAPYITMMKHSDQTRPNPSFINVTAEALGEKGSLSPRCPGGNATHRNTLLHVILSLHQSWPGCKEKTQLIGANRTTQTPRLCTSMAQFGRTEHKDCRS